MEPGYIYAPYVPYSIPYVPYICYSILGIDESHQGGAIFIFKSMTNDKIWYDYDNNKAWNVCYSIKAKKKLQYFRSMCRTHIDSVAANEDDWAFGNEDFSIDFHCKIT